MNLTLTREQRKLYAKKVYQAGIDEGIRRTLRLLELQKQSRAKTQTFSAEHIDPREQGLSSADVEDYTRYFAPNDEGQFPGNLHEAFGVNAMEFAKRSNLSPRFIEDGNEGVELVWVPRGRE